MSKRFYGSICVTDLIELAKKQHSAFTKSEKGKIYANVNVWLNDEEDKFGNVLSIQLNPKKDNKEKDGTPYIGNCKESEQKPITNKDIASITEPIDDLPF